MELSELENTQTHTLMYSVTSISYAVSTHWSIAACTSELCTKRSMCNAEKRDIVKHLENKRTSARQCNLVLLLLSLLSDSSLFGSGLTLAALSLFNLNKSSNQNVKAHQLLSILPYYLLHRHVDAVPMVLVNILTRVIQIVQVVYISINQ